MRNVLLLILAGGLGALCRYGVCHWTSECLGKGFPWGTFIANAFGCFMFGLIWAMAEHKFIVSPPVRFIALTGFVGSFTTFSTFSFESFRLFSSHQWSRAILYFLTTQIIGFLSLYLGLKGASFLSGVSFNISHIK